MSETDTRMITKTQLQMDLPNTSEACPGSSTANGNGFCDPAFAGNKILPIHRWVPWIAGFSRDFVRDAMSRYANPGDTVLDPFCGVGTTIVEALLLGDNAVGFEINPYAALATKVKANARVIDPGKVRDTIGEMQGFSEKALSNGYAAHSVPPKGFKTRTAFYSPAVMRKVLVLQDFILGIREPHLRDLFRLAFASTMVRYSNYSYEPSLGRRVSAGRGEIPDFPVIETNVAKLREMASDIEWFRRELPSNGNKATVINDSFFRLENYLKPGSVDVLVTSPPYLNNYHYNRNSRPQLYWLGYAESPQDFHHLEDGNFGKYWQTVREQPDLELQFVLPSTQLADKLAQVRSRNPHKGIYGGHGWANYAVTYFNDCYRFAQCIQYCLKPGGVALVVIGNSILQGIPIETDRFFASIAEKVGLDVKGIDIPRATRVGNSIIRSGVRAGKAHESNQLYEAVVQLRKR